MTNDLTDEQLIKAARASAVAEERERCARIAEGYEYPLAGTATGQVIGRLIRDGDVT